LKRLIDIQDLELLLQSPKVNILAKLARTDPLYGRFLFYTPEVLKNFGFNIVRLLQLMMIFSLKELGIWLSLFPEFFILEL